MGFPRFFTPMRDKNELLLREVLAKNATIIQKRESVSHALAQSIALWHYFATFQLVAEASSGDDNLLSPEHRAHLPDETAYLEKVAACINNIGQKWLYYTEVLKFKPETPLSEIIESFAIPMRQFIGNTYPSLYAAGPGLSAVFWLMVFRGVQKTGFPSPDAINRAIEELDVKLRSLR
jgi:hypothetical protein